MIKYFFLIICSLFIVNVSQAADIQFTYSAFSYHFKKTEEYNQFNPGFGIIKKTSKDTNLLAGLYKNSYDNLSIYLLQEKELKYNFSLDAGLVTGYFNHVSPALFPVYTIKMENNNIRVLFIPPINKYSTFTLGFQFLHK